MVNHAGNTAISRWYESFGVQFGVELPESLPPDRLVLHLPPGTVETPRHAVSPMFQMVETPEPEQNDHNYGWSVFSQGENLSWGPTDIHAFEQLESALQLHVAEFSEQWAFVHAGVVCWNDWTIVIPGTSFSGKSTLVHAFVDAGATYYSDEYAPIGPSGCIAPYRRPISLRDGPFGDARRVASHIPNQEVGTAPSRSILLKTSFQQDGHWQPVEMTHSEIVIALIENSVSIRRRPGPVLSAFSEFVKHTKGFKTPRSEYPAVIEWVRYFIGRS